MSYTEIIAFTMPGGPELLILLGMCFLPAFLALWACPFRTRGARLAAMLSCLIFSWIGFIVVYLIYNFVRGREEMLRGGQTAAGREGEV